MNFEACERRMAVYGLGSWVRGSQWVNVHPFLGREHELSGIYGSFCKPHRTQARQLRSGFKQQCQLL